MNCRLGIQVMHYYINIIFSQSSNLSQKLSHRELGLIRSRSASAPIRSCASIRVSMLVNAGQ